MRLSKLAFLAALCSGAAITGGNFASSVMAQSPGNPSGIMQVSHCDCGGGPDCGCEVAMPDFGCDGTCDGGCDGACGSSRGSAIKHGVSACGGLGCSGDDCCEGSLFDSGFLGDCDLGDPWELFGECCGFTMGGWVQLGYHSDNLILFNSRKNELQLHQAWLFAEKAIDTTDGFDIGGRIDYVYGTDSQDTQAFGIDNDHWDNGWDNGPDYGHALPQVYGEFGYGDLTAKVGHFYTIIGYEVVQATGNFFYSHAYTMYNSEPFTHTGALLTYSMSDDIDIYGGYVMGWDSGFEDNGDTVIGGSAVQLTDDVSVTSTFVAGRFGEGASDERGIMSSTVAQIQLTEKLSYVFQTDLLDSEDAAGATVRDTFGINQYLFRTINDCVAYGARFEWWNVDADSQGFLGDNAIPAAITANDFNVYALTLGANFRPHANVTIRPEIRWDWVDNTDSLAAADFEILEDNDDRQTTFGVDTIFTF